MQGMYNVINVIIPNIITFFRVLIVPFIVIFLIKGDYISTTISFVLFLLGSITDAFDGMVARKLNATSEFGFIIDPIADKILVLGTLFTLSVIEYLNIPLSLIVIILLRDVIVSILKPVSDKLGFAIPTTFFAKTKTTLQFIGISIIMLYMILIQIQISGKINFEAINLRYGVVSYLPLATVLLLTLVTLASGIEYVVLFIKGITNKMRCL